MDDLLIAADPDWMAGERRKARELKKSAWWKNQVGQGRCSYCGNRFPPRELTMDHRIPLVRGGRSTRGNCVPACRACNRLKQNLPPREWQARLEAGDLEGEGLA